jgi:hypothetical protein
LQVSGRSCIRSCYPRPERCGLLRETRVKAQLPSKAFWPWLLFLGKELSLQWGNMTKANSSKSSSIISIKPQTHLLLSSSSFPLHINNSSAVFCPCSIKMPKGKVTIFFPNLTVRVIPLTIISSPGYCNSCLHPRGVYFSLALQFGCTLGMIAMLFS